MKLRMGLLGVVLMMALAGATGCRPESGGQIGAPPEAGVEPLALRAYDVPEASQGPILSLLRTLLRHNDETPVGRVDTAPGNKVVVLAPERVLSGIDSLMSDLALTEVEIAPLSTYVVDHWLVLGRPAAQTSTVGNLAALQPALDAIAATDGPMTFALLEHLRVRSMDHEQAAINGVHGSVNQVLARENAQLRAELDVSAVDTQWRTSLTITEGQLIVMAQVGFSATLQSDPFAASVSPTPMPGPWEPEPHTTLYHVFRVELDETP